MKRIIAVAVGQSNERGRRVKKVKLSAELGDPQVSTYGAPCVDPLPPKGNVGGDWGSLWPRLVTNMGRHGVWLNMRVAAVGGSSIITDWCGDSGGVPYAHTDPGFDPGGLFTDALAAVQAGVFDERWALIAFGQADAIAGASLANYRLAHENAAAYFAANGVSVALGLSCYRPNYTDEYNDFSTAIDNAVASSGAIAGPNMYRILGTSPGLYDSDHLSQNGYDAYADAWYDALVEGGW